MLNDEEDEEDGISISGRLLGFLLLGIALVFVGIAVLVVASIGFGWVRKCWRYNFDWSNSDCFRFGT